MPSMVTIGTNSHDKFFTRTATQTRTNTFFSMKIEIQTLSIISTKAKRFNNMLTAMVAMENGEWIMNNNQNSITDSQTKMRKTPIVPMDKTSAVALRTV
jgi:hypothetical protein